MIFTDNCMIKKEWKEKMKMNERRRGRWMRGEDEDGRWMKGENEDKDRTWDEGNNRIAWNNIVRNESRVYKW